jgi:hypothetical protein
LIELHLRVADVLSVLLSRRRVFPDDGINVHIVLKWDVQDCYMSLGLKDS